MRWAPILVLVLLAGCADPGTDGASAGDDQATGEDSGSNAPTWGEHLSYSGSASTVLSDVHLLGGRGVGLEGSNCLHIGDEVRVIHDGWVEARWTSDVPDLGMELRMVADPSMETSGTSPLRLELKEIGPDDFFEDYSIAFMPLAGTGARSAVELTFTFELTDYDGPTDPSWELAGECAFG